MSFKPSQYEIKDEGAAPGEMRVVKLDEPSKPDVQAFVPSRIREPGQGEYRTVKSKFGPLAATDASRASRTQKDSRFAINPLLREPLAVEEEERRVIEERVRDRISAVSEDVRRQASEVGFQEGFKKGHDEASAKFREEGRQSLEDFQIFLASCENAKRDIFKANERYLVELVFRVSKMVLMRELQADKQYVTRLTQELVERVGARENIRIKLNPADLEVATQLRQELELSLGTLKNVNVEASAQVEGGGCIVETQWNAIDASVETQLKNIHASLTGERSGG